MVGTAYRRTHTCIRSGQKYEWLVHFCLFCFVFVWLVQSEPSKMFSGPSTYAKKCFLTRPYMRPLYARASYVYAHMWKSAVPYIASYFDFTGIQTQKAVHLCTMQNELYFQIDSKFVFFFLFFVHEIGFPKKIKIFGVIGGTYFCCVFSVKLISFFFGWAN